ncbi:glycerate kinase [Pseudorhodoferax sp.]|uniref:glycerate kinase n=1 Tax=Pseudorhodoferax sp. TaxID=1993553 RepID=UPI0039E47E92
MQFSKILVPLAGLVVLAVAFREYGWPGAALVGGGIVMWALLHITRLMTVMRRAADRPIGYVGSAVMLNAKLKPRVNLLHVVAMTRALGERLTPGEQQPEVYRWRDKGGSYVDCTFQDGRLVEWRLTRPPAPAGADGAP